MKDLLVIDDETTIRMFIWKALKREGYTVHLAKDGKEAIEKLNEIRPRLVLTDFLLPDISGLELIKIIKEKYPETPVLIMTGYMSDEEADKALAAGAFDFMRKPIDLDYLIKTVRAKMLTVI